MTCFSFGKSARIRKRVDFLALSAIAKKWSTPNFLILIGTPSDSGARLGITVSKKVGNAVCRNRVKRLVREFFRRNMVKFPLSDCNIIARSNAVDLGYTEVCQELANALHRIGQRINH